MFGRKKRVPPPDPLAFFNKLLAVQIGDEYTEADRHRDFKAVFLGDERGRRVLYQLLAWTHMFEPSFVPEAGDETIFREGERNIGLQLFACMNTEPAPPGSEMEGDDYV